MSASTRLREIRKTLGLTQEKFGEKIGLKQSQMRDIESGKQKVSVEIAEEIEKIFDIDAGWLVFGKGTMTATSLSPQNNNFAVPMIEAYAGCGSASGFSNMLINSKDNLIIDPRIFPSDFLRPHLAAIRIAGDSMEPTLRGGDIAFVQTKNGSDIVEVGDVYLIAYDGGVYIKRLHFQGRKVKIISDNQLYDPFWYEHGDSQIEFDIIGKVVAVLRFGTPLLFK
ncbi:MAG: S24 family peptidase [Campylobacterales bacterium]